MKFRRLIECNTRNIFLKNHTQNVVEKLVPDPFIKKNKIEHISGSIAPNVRCQVEFQVEVYQNL